MIEKSYGLVVFGATSFVGKLLCRYLVDEFGFGGRLRWAAAGRSRNKPGQKLLIQQLKLRLPTQPPPKISSGTPPQT
jgi:short subunit dehydrogenase-like uncharacterized protein